jgi:hypothetical protein
MQRLRTWLLVGSSTGLDTRFYRRFPRQAVVGDKSPYRSSTTVKTCNRLWVLKKSL